MNTKMTPELQAECDAVFAHWKRTGEYDQAFAYTLIADRDVSPFVRKAASDKFAAMYDATVIALGLTPVIPPPEPEGPKYVWRNGARVKVA